MIGPDVVLTVIPFFWGVLFQPLLTFVVVIVALDFFSCSITSFFFHVIFWSTIPAKILIVFISEFIPFMLIVNFVENIVIERIPMLLLNFCPIVKPIIFIRFFSVIRIVFIHVRRIVRITTGWILNTDSDTVALDVWHDSIFGNLLGSRSTERIKLFA